MKTKKHKPNEKIMEFEYELARIQHAGHISAVQKTADKHQVGVELFLVSNMSPHQAHSIASFIQKKYNFDALFYVKKNSIKVTYTK